MHSINVGIAELAIVARWAPGERLAIAVQEGMLGLLWTSLRMSKNSLGSSVGFGIPYASLGISRIAQQQQRHQQQKQQQQQRATMKNKSRIRLKFFFVQWFTATKQFQHLETKCLTCCFCPLRNGKVHQKLFAFELNPTRVSKYWSCLRGAQSQHVVTRSSFSYFNLGSPQMIYVSVLL